MMISMPYPKPGSSSRACLLGLLLLPFLATTPHAVEGQLTPRRGLPELPEAVTSFGAAVLGDFLYVYSGHTGEAHNHSRENLSGHFRRLNLRWSGPWEELPMEETLQGLALVAHGNYLYRIGGVHSRNAANEPEDMHSTDSVSRFDPETRTWTAMTPLPEARSSLDAAVLGDRVYVLGGWKLSGDPDNATWGKHYYSADLTRTPLQWEKLPDAPFQGRALAVASAKSHIYAIGGMDENDSTSDKTFGFDPAAGKWFEAPAWPGKSRLKGFGMSAYAVEDTVWSTGYDGKVFALRENEAQWIDTGIELAEPRFFHRLLPRNNDQLILLGGASKKGHLKTMETLDLSLLQARSIRSATQSASPQRKASPSSRGQEHWTGFRGDGTSRTHARDLPTFWSDDQNIAWKVQPEGVGQSSPVIWGEMVFVTSVLGPAKEQLMVSALDLATGKALWKQTFKASQTTPISDYISKAAPTPCVDSDHVYAFFESGDIIALDHQGQVSWSRSLTEDYGPFAGNHGVGSSPLLCQDGLVLLIDHDGPSYLVCLDKATGRTRWKVDREKRVSWSSPILMREMGQDRILISSNGLMESYDPSTGDRIWFVSGLRMNTVASPSWSDQWAIVGSSDKTSSRMIRLGGSGEVTQSHVMATLEDASSNFGSPLVFKDRVYSVNRAGVAFCNALADGKLLWSLRLPSSCWASPLGAAEGVYFFCDRGETIILDPQAEEPVVLVHLKVKDSTRALGYAAVDRHLVLRTEGTLYCFKSSPSKTVKAASASDPTP